VGLAVLIGATLLERSTLFALGPFLSGWELLAAPRIRRQNVRDALILCIVPFLFLLPWIAMNWGAYHRFIPFEYQEADSNIVAGALGHVTGIEGDWHLLIASPPDDQQTGAVLSWAVREIAAHPGRYAVGVVRRFAYFGRLHPLVSLLSILALLRWRRRPGWSEVGVVSFYFVGIHSLMAIHGAYLEPLALLLTVCAPFAFIPPPDGKMPDSYDAPWVGKASLRFSVAAGAAVVLFALFSGERALAVARPLPEGGFRAGLDAAIAENPDDAALLVMRGLSRLRRHDASDAISDLSRAARLRPENAEVHRDLDMALYARGLPRPLMLQRSECALPLDMDACMRVEWLKSLQLMRWGRSDSERRELTDAWRRWLSQIEVGENKYSGDAERRAQAAMLADARSRFRDEADFKMSSYYKDAVERKRFDRDIDSATSP
jgi:hypothetical protein